MVQPQSLLEQAGAIVTNRGPLRILMIHNRYLIPAGEDASTDLQVELLEAAGHEVRLLVDTNERVAELGLTRTAVRSLWSREARAAVGDVLAGGDFDVVHVQNSFPLFSPSVLYAAASHNVPVVHSLRNFRLLCPQGMLYRAGNVCLDCVGKRFAWPGVWHRCYRNSAAGSMTVATMAAGHDAAGTWRNKVFRYVVPSRAARDVYVRAGWARDAIHVIPNFVYPDPGVGSHAGGFALFLGRLDAVKGIETLLAAWRDHGIDYPLKIAGAGPLEAGVNAAASGHNRIEFLGAVDRAEARRLLGEASFVVVPTLGVETFGRVAAEALARGTPAIVAGHGGLSEIVTDGETGLTFPPGDAGSLAGKVKELVSGKVGIEHMRAAGRETYLARYAGEQVLDAWIDLYREAVASG
jgi:glycosyltransferase involved in cell wall biosynthesis